MLVTICIPSIIERIEKFSILIKKIQKQLDENKLNNKVQIISHVDNRSIPLTYKRNLMQKAVKGKYFIHLDDDDDIADDYCLTVCNTIEYLDKEVDVITYDQKALVGIDIFYVKCDLNQDMNLKYIGIHPGDCKRVYLRYPWQWCLWNSKKFKHIYRTDADTNAREDQNWLKRIKLEYPKTQYNIPKVLHTYNFQDASMSTCQ
tara:strand:+ start:820 stop:1428 length:609 start_codon:yes stop_codon:yes gene_type:complete